MTMVHEMNMLELRQYARDLEAANEGLNDARREWSERYQQRIAKLEGVIAEMDEILARKQREMQFYKNTAYNAQEQNDIKLGRAFREHLRDGCSDEFRDGFAAAIRALGDE